MEARVAQQELQVVQVVVVAVMLQHQLEQELLVKEMRVDQEQILVETLIMNKLVAVVVPVKKVLLMDLGLVVMDKIIQQSLVLHMENPVGSRVVVQEVVVQTALVLSMMEAKVVVEIQV